MLVGLDACGWLHHQIDFAWELHGARKHASGRDASEKKVIVVPNIT